MAGIRTPSPKKSLTARTTGATTRKLKSAVNPVYGKKGAGVLHPTRSVKSAVYRKTTVKPTGLISAIGVLLFYLVKLVMWLVKLVIKLLVWVVESIYSVVTKKPRPSQVRAEQLMAEQEAEAERMRQAQAEADARAEVEAAEAKEQARINRNRKSAINRLTSSDGWEERPAEERGSLLASLNAKYDSQLKDMELK